VLQPDIKAKEGESTVAKKSVQGTCKLCRKHRRLSKSHYLSRALHKLSRQDGQDAVMLTPNVILATKRHLWAHLLCQECESRLNKLGETPVLKLLDNGTGFPLLERIEHGIALTDGGGVMTFSGRAMGIDTDALAYFALGLLWKGGVRRWNTTAGQTTAVQLGPFEKSIRAYLLGETGIPPGVYVAVGVCKDAGSRGMIFAPSLVRGSAWRMFSIVVRGIWFHVITDESVAKSTRGICCVQSDIKVLHLVDCSKQFLQAGRHLYKTAKIAANLRRR